MIALVGAGLLVAVGTPLGWWITHRSSGAPAFSAVDTGAAVRLATSSSPTTPTQRSTPPLVTTRPAITPPPIAASVPNSPPVRLRITSIAVDAPVLAVGVDENGDMQIPEQISQIGWYRWSSLPGASTGSIVLAGHVDSAVQGLGALFRLRNVPNGTNVVLTTADGRAHTYRVVAREEYPKTTVPLAAIFSRTGAARLTIVTCGGHFDRSKRSYDDNIVVTAVPV